MSAEINNSVYRQQKLKELIQRLHNGEDFEAVKADFAREFEGVGADEIANMEKALIEQEGVRVEEIQKLCDVHASLFKGSVADIHADKKHSTDQGHPTWVLREENRAVERLFSDRIDVHTAAIQQGNVRAVGELIQDLADLWQIDRHYSRKENLWFPIMERYGITAPPKVMWGVDDEIRDMIKQCRSQLDELASGGKPEEGAIQEFLTLLADTKNQIMEMISKEEDILIPMAVRCSSSLTGDRSLKEAVKSGIVSLMITLHGTSPLSNRRWLRHQQCQKELSPYPPVPLLPNCLLEY
jgi:hypothetical protein